MWSEWFNRGLPRVGDLIRVHTDEETVREGFVVNVSDGRYVTMSPDAPSGVSALRWCRWIGPERGSVRTREEELCE